LTLDALLVPEKETFELAAAAFFLFFLSFLLLGRRGLEFRDTCLGFSGLGFRGLGFRV
jgi:hypothetical protein